MGLSNKSSNSKDNQEVSDTVRWFNGTYGILTTSNGADIELVGGYDKNNPEDVSMLKSMLESWWDIKTREDADETIECLKKLEMHNQSLLDEYNEYGLGLYSREELEKEIVNLDEEDQSYLLMMYDAVENYGENAIAAWDLIRAMQLTGQGYVVGFYTYEEAMEMSYETAKQLQSIYGSWEEMVEGYFDGLQYWSEEDPNDVNSDLYKRRYIYEQLKTQYNSPYKIPWNLEFEKDW